LSCGTSCAIGKKSINADRRHGFSIPLATGIRYCVDTCDRSVIVGKYVDTVLMEEMMRSIF
jgi:hypothetical protein